jgi:membrane fusion protein, multidrug efflux system
MSSSTMIQDLNPNKPRLVRRLLIFAGAAIVIILVILLAKILMIRSQMGSMKPPPPPTVTTMAAQVQDWSDQIDTVGSLRSMHGTDLSAEVAGLVRAIRFRSGQDLSAGDVLVELNAEPERAQLASFQAAADLARTVLKRDKEQLSVSAVSQATIDADEADLKNKLAQVDQQKAIIEKKLIRAPFNGRAGVTTVNPGQYLNAGDKVVTFQDIDNLYIDFNVPQRLLASVQPGQTVKVHVDAWPQRAFTAKVTAVSSAVDSSTRNVRIEARMPNPKRELLPGMFVKVGLLVGSDQKFLTVPQSAVSFNPYGATVFVADPGKEAGSLVAKEVFVSTGATRGDQVAIVKGLKEGETVVTSGQLKLKSGQALLVDNSVTPHNDASPTPQEH